MFSEWMSAPESVPVLQAGAFFPDWGYGCLSADRDSEAAHWPPFQRAWAEYVIEKYGLQGGGDNAQKRLLTNDEKAHLQTLVAFAFAISSHQSAGELSLCVCISLSALTVYDRYNMAFFTSDERVHEGGCDD